MIEFGPFRYDAESRFLYRGDEEIMLPPRVLAVLESLLKRPGKVVAKEAVLESAWKGAFVGEDSLTQAVSKLRDALGDDPQRPKYIQTIPKRGYRFIAEVSARIEIEEALANPSQETGAGVATGSGPGETDVGALRRPLARDRSSQAILGTVTVLAVTVLIYVVFFGIGSEAAPAGEDAIVSPVSALDDRPTIAVLPLDNLSAREENSYFAAGVHAELLRRLSLVRELAVISRTSVLRYADTPKAVPEIAAELGADHIVAGSVQEDQGRLYIQVELIDPSTNRQTWSERYDRTLEDIFDLQSELAQAIAVELEATVGPDERARIEARPTQDLVAYDLYLQAVELNIFIREEYDEAVELLRRATERDPAFALAHAILADVYRNAFWHRVSPVADSASARADIALELAPDLPEALGVKGSLLGGEEGRVLLLRALALDPSFGGAWGRLARVGWVSGDSVEGAVAGRRGVQVAPNETYSALHLGHSLGFVQMYDEAAEWFEYVLELDPGHTSAFYMVFYLIADGDYPEARRWLLRMREETGDVINADGLTALLDIAEGNLDAAASLLATIVRSDPDLGLDSAPTAQALLGWLLAESGDPEGRERLESLRVLRLEQVAEGNPRPATYFDLSLIASVLGSPDEQVRWFLEAEAKYSDTEAYLMRGFAWHDPIRNTVEFQAWLEGYAEDLADQRRELEALGPWTVDAVLGRTGR